MAKFSDLYPVSTGGSTAIAGFAWQTAVADFTATSNIAYYCDTSLGNILATLPSSPSGGDKVAFLITGVKSLFVTTTANVKGSLLATDFVLKTSQNYVMVIYEYMGASTGWSWQTLNDSWIASTYIGAAPILYRVEYDNLLSEIGFYYSDSPDMLVTLSGANVTSFYRDANYSSSANLSHNVGSLNNGDYSAGYVGTIGGYNSFIVELPIGKLVSAVRLGCQPGVYNLPTYVKLFYGTSPTDWTLSKNWNISYIADQVGTKFII